MTSIKLLGCMFAAAMAVSGAAQAGLVTNGSFESTAVSGAWQQLSVVEGWHSSATGNTAFEIQKGALQGGQGGFNPLAADGKQYAELNANALTSIWQIIDTSQQGRYALSFAYSGRPDTANGAVSAMNVYWGDLKLNTSVLTGNTGGVWSTFSVKDLVAASATTKLRFESIGPLSSPTYGSYLDAVAVTVAVPEPGTVGIFMLGLALVGFTSLRKKVK